MWGEVLSGGQNQFRFGSDFVIPPCLTHPPRRVPSRASASHGRRESTATPSTSSLRIAGSIAARAALLARPKSSANAASSTRSSKRMLPVLLLLDYPSPSGD